MFKGVAACLLGALLSACGGGGSDGDGDGDTQAQPQASGAFSVSFDRSAVSATIVEGGIATMTIVGRGSREPDGPLYVGAVATGGGIDPRIPVTFSELQATINIRSAAGLSAGTHTGQIVLNACADPACQRHYTGSPKAVSYNIKVVPKISASAPSLTLASPEGGNSAVTTLSVTPMSADTVVQATVEDAASSWLRVELLSNNIFRVFASAEQLSSGTYAGAVRLATKDGLQTLSVPVTLTVSSGIMVSELSEVSLHAATALADTNLQLPVQTASGVGFNWAASSTTPWIKIDTTNGVSGEPLKWHVDLSAANGLANGAPHEGQIRIASPTSALTPVNVRVVLNKRLPEVDVVAPYSVPSGKATVVRVRGRGFDAVADLMGSVRFGAVAPLAVKRINDTSLQVSLPALTPGSYSVVVHKLSALTPITHALKALAPQTFNYAAISTQALYPDSVGLPSQFVYDPDRKAFTAINRMTSDYYATQWTSNLIQFRFNGNQWIQTTKLLTRVSALGQSADGSHILTGHPWNDSSSKLTLFNSETLAQEEQLTVPIRLDSNDIPLMVTNDNRVMINEGTRHDYLSFFDLRTRQIVRYAGDPSAKRALMSYYHLSNGGISGDGEYIIAGPDGSSSPMPAPISISASEGVVRLASTPFFYNSVGINDDGSRVYIGFGWVLDASGNTLGNWDFTPGSAWKTVGGGYSTDGKMVYALAYAASVMAPRGSKGEAALPAGSPKPRVFVWDATKTDALGKFVLQGYFELDHYPGCRTLNYSLEELCKPQVFSSASPDGKTLLFLGNRHFVVAPIPATLLKF